MAGLIILRGNSGSGKTTIAKELQKKLGSNTLLISQDVIRREMLMVSDGPDTMALPMLKELLRYGSDHCETVILEGILVADWYRSLFELAKDLFGNNIYAYYFDIPFEETLKRHKTRAKCSEFGEEAMREWWVEKDFSDALNETTITADKDKETIVQEVLSAMVDMYQTVLQECRKWFNSVLSQYDELLSINIEKDDSSCFIGNIDSDRYISQIIVSESDFRPYRYVEFTIYDLDKDADQSPAFWYGDQDNSSVEEIIDNLNKGLRLVIQTIKPQAAT